MLITGYLCPTAFRCVCDSLIFFVFPDICHFSEIFTAFYLQLRYIQSFSVNSLDLANSVLFQDVCEI